MNDGAVTANVGWALLGCAVIVAIFLPLSVRSLLPQDVSQWPPIERDPASLTRRPVTELRGEL